LARPLAQSCGRRLAPWCFCRIHACRPAKGEDAGRQGDRARDHRGMLAHDSDSPYRTAPSGAVTNVRFWAKRPIATTVHARRLTDVRYFLAEHTPVSFLQKKQQICPCPSPVTSRRLKHGAARSGRGAAGTGTATRRAGGVPALRRSSRLAYTHGAIRRRGKSPKFPQRGR